jgi:spoIIIJ-associated protein
MSEGLESRIIEFTNRVLRLGGWDLEAEIEAPVAADAGDGADAGDQKLTVQVRGDDVSLLLGRNAELLDALEYVSNRAFAREAGRDGRIVFDSGSYRSRREKELQLMAAKAAERVRTSRTPFTFDPMSPNERRIIHTALIEDKTIRTESKGDGIDRKVVIYPA